MPMSGASVPVRSRKSLRQGTGSLCGKSPTGSFAAAGFDCLTEKGNRMIYREAFRDLMPESLLKVDYKEFLSLKHHRRTVKSEQQQNNEKNFFLSRLDREFWKGILDPMGRVPIELCHRWAPLHPPDRRLRCRQKHSGCGVSAPGLEAHHR